MRRVKGGESTGFRKRGVGVLIQSQRRQFPFPKYGSAITFLVDAIPANQGFFMVDLIYALDKITVSQKIHF